MEGLFAVSALLMAVLEVEEPIELTDDWDSVESVEAVAMPGHHDSVVGCSGRAVVAVAGREQAEVLERLGWTALVVQPWILVMPLACYGWIEAFAGC